jgi:uncharacterized protein YwgA
MDDAPEEETFMTKKRFSKMVENTVRDTKMSYMDSIVYMCEKTDMEVEDVKKFLSASIVQKLEEEALGLNCLDKEHYRQEYTRNTLY